MIDAARKIAGEKADSARLRAATCLALPLVAGRLAQDFDILRLPQAGALGDAPRSFGSNFLLRRQ